jgi:hypothetical protein
MSIEYFIKEAMAWNSFCSLPAEECAYLRLFEKMTSAYHGRHG